MEGSGRDRVTLGGEERTPPTRSRDGFGESQHLRVQFGPDGSWLLLQGRNGYWGSGGLDDGIISRLKRISKRGQTVDCVRLLPNGYFISDSEGTEWKGLGAPLAEEVKSGGKDPVLDVIQARWQLDRDTPDSLRQAWVSARNSHVRLRNL